MTNHLLESWQILAKKVVLSHDRIWLLGARYSQAASYPLLFAQALGANTSLLEKASVNDFAIVFFTSWNAADAKKASEILGSAPRYSDLATIITDAWCWHNKIFGSK